MKKYIIASFCGLFVVAAESADALGVERSAMGSPEKVCFAGGGEEHFENRTKRVVGEAAEGEDFRIVVKPGCAGDTAWTSISLPLPVPAGAKFVSCDFELYSDVNWRCKTPNSGDYQCRFIWKSADGARVSAPPWVDALGVNHDSEIFDPTFNPKVFSRFRVVAEVAPGATTVAVQFGRDAPNVPEDGKMSVRNCTIAFHAQGERPEPISPDVTGPSVQIAFASPNPNPCVAVRYSVRDQSGVDWSSLSFSEGGRELAFKREGDFVILEPGREWTRGDHHVKVVAKDVLGCETRETKAFRIGERPSVPGTSLRSDGVLLVAGRPVFPIGLYAFCPREANLYSLARCFDDLAAAGVNLAHSYTHMHDPEFLRGCAKHGMVSFTAEYDAANGSKGFEDRWRQEPTIGLWYVGDDTCLHYSPETIANRVEALKALDGTRLTCHADIYTTRFREYADIVDVFMPEIYPIRGMKSDADCVATTIDIMEKSFSDMRVTSSGKLRTVWPIIQYFKGWTAWKRVPTPEEVYAMSFAALIHGGKGITWYTYGGHVNPERKRFNYGVTSSAEMWNATTNLTRRLSFLSPVLISGDVAQPRAPISLSGPEKDACGRPSVTLLVKEHEGAVYVFAVNATRETVRARVFLGRDCSAEGRVLFEERQVRAEDGAFEDEFAPLGVHIYRFCR